jgi:hypothetical protein
LLAGKATLYRQQGKKLEGGQQSQLFFSFI